MNSLLKILGIAGSLRKGSYNRGLLRAAQSLAASSVHIEDFDIAEIPLYNDDVYTKGFPAAVETFRARIRAADALLIMTPEYNYSVPGVLKNAIDWASRPPEQPFDGKPVALMGASAGIFGTTRAQHHLRQSFVFLNALLLARPEVMIPTAIDKFDEKGDLVDAASKKYVAEQLRALET
jgi:chromate reductase